MSMSSIHISPYPPNHLGPPTPYQFLPTYHTAQPYTIHTGHLPRVRLCDLREGGGGADGHDAARGGAYLTSVSLHFLYAHVFSAVAFLFF